LLTILSGEMSIFENGKPFHSRPVSKIENWGNAGRIFCEFDCKEECLSMDYCLLRTVYILLPDAGNGLGIVGGTTFESTQLFKHKVLTLDLP